MAEFEKVLVKSGGVLYSTANNTLEALTETEATALLFQAYGADTLPEWELISALTNPEILLWNSSEETTPSATAIMTATPLPQLVMGESALIANSTAAGVENVAVVCKGNPLFSCSFNGGDTWCIYTNGSWVEFSDNTTGMTADEIVAITAQEWALSPFGTDGNDYFSVRFLLSSAEDTVTSIYIKYTQKTEQE